MASSTFHVLQTTNWLAHWPTDWFIVAGLVALLALITVRYGSALVTALAISLPLATVLSAYLPATAFLKSTVPQEPQGNAAAIVSGIVLVVLFLAIHRIVYNFSEARGVLSALIAGAAAAIVVLVVWLQVPALDTLWHFNPQVQTVLGATYRFWWLFAAYFGLAYVRS